MSRVERLVPRAGTSVALFLGWLALNRSAAVGQVLIGLALALGLPALTEPLRPTRARLRKPLRIVRFVLTVVYDVMRSNLEVASDVLRWRWRQPRSRFVVVPLELRDPVGLVALAVVTTIVPGTVWSELAVDRTKLLLHVWSVDDETTFVARYKARYELPLREIFE